MLDHWAYRHQVALDFSRRGTPGHNALCEAFNGSVRRECLSQAYFSTNAEVQTALDRWRDDYNNHRPDRVWRTCPRRTSATGGRSRRPPERPLYAAPDGPTSGPSAYQAEAAEAPDVRSRQSGPTSAPSAPRCVIHASCRRASDPGAVHYLPLICRAPDAALSSSVD